MNRITRDIPVVVTGINGLMGEQLGRHLLECKFDVIGSVRDRAKFDGVRRAMISDFNKRVGRGDLSIAFAEDCIDRLTLIEGLPERVTLTSGDEIAMDAIQLAIESIVEDESEKAAHHLNLAAACREAIQATNTSTLENKKVFTGIQNKKPGKTAGLHFFNPVGNPKFKLVEIGKWAGTSDETVFRLVEFCYDIAKIPVVCADSAGYIVNRALTGKLNDRYRMQGIILIPDSTRGTVRVATPEEADRLIDISMKYGANEPMGPRELEEFIGAKVVYHMTGNIGRAGMFDDGYWTPTQGLRDSAGIPSGES